jgi:hypothetical protein
MTGPFAGLVVRIALLKSFFTIDFAPLYRRRPLPLVFLSKGVFESGGVFLCRRVSFCGSKVGFGTGRVTMWRWFARHFAPFWPIIPSKHFVYRAIRSSSSFGRASPPQIRFLVAVLRPFV